MSGTVPPEAAWCNAHAASAASALLGLSLDRNRAGNYRFNTMEHNGIRYTISREPHSGIWHWRTVLGTPATVRAGEETTRIQAEYKVEAVIDWWLSQQATLQPDHPLRDRP